MRHLCYLLGALLLVLSLASLAAAAQSVRVQITENTNVRSTADGPNVLVPELTLPAGAIVEVSVDKLEVPLLMRFWNAIIGREEKKHPFVKGIKLISAPGFSKRMVKDFNLINREEGLYMSKKQLDDGELLRNLNRNKRIRTKKSSFAFRSHDMRMNEEDKEVAEKKALERLNAARNAAKKAGEQGCATCGDTSRYYQGWLNAGVPEAALRRALTYYNENRARIRNSNYITINDYTDHSGQKRMYVLNTNTGGIEKYYVAHGEGSDKRHGGYARNFGDSRHRTPSGILMTGETYNGAHGYSLRLDGMEAQNRNTRRRSVVMHSNYYASENFIRNYGKAGRSEGCVVVDPAVSRQLIKKLQGGSVMLNYTGD